MVCIRRDATDYTMSDVHKRMLDHILLHSKPSWSFRNTSNSGDSPVATHMLASTCSRVSSALLRRVNDDREEET